VTVPDHLKVAVAELAQVTGIAFSISAEVVTGTQLYVVYSLAHPLPDRYSAESGTFGFRVPTNFPDANPEDSFFVVAPSLKLREPDPVRNNIDIHRASQSSDFFKGTELDGQLALVFSWHLWDRSSWNRRKHTLLDHYTHCVRRFDQPEHD
jgi:hypothetical protein